MEAGKEMLKVVAKEAAMEAEVARASAVEAKEVMERRAQAAEATALVDQVSAAVEVAAVEAEVVAALEMEAVVAQAQVKGEVVSEAEVQLEVLPAVKVGIEVGRQEVVRVLECWEKVEVAVPVAVHLAGAVAEEQALATVVEE
jgi:hypothetical protein